MFTVTMPFLQDPGRQHMCIVSGRHAFSCGMPHKRVELNRCMVGCSRRTGDEGAEALRELGLQLVDGPPEALPVARGVLHKARGRGCACQPLLPLRQGAACAYIGGRSRRV